MSVAKNPKPRKKMEKKGQILCHEAQNVGSKHKEDEDESQTLHQPKATRGSKDIINNNVPSTKKNLFTIPRKKNEAKELLQSIRFDSRETKELLRSVQLSLRDPNFWPSFKFERVEFVNNDKLGRKYGEKKQALRLEAMRTNRELEDKFAFLYTTSRNEVKSICEHGIYTGKSSLKSLGDPKLGVYLCRFADVISKRPLSTEDTGYLLVFRVVKGKVRFVGGSNPELQPTPHHDCHVSKSLTTLSSKASHSDVFESSQFYFYEIDENSDDFHVKHPRQVLPYAVLTFSILRPQRPQTKLDEKSEGKKAVVTGQELLSSADENVLYSPNRIEDQEDLISDANISWSGVLAINKKQFAYVDFLSYSRKKHPLPINVDHFDISWKVSHDDLRSLLKCPVFSNGKPASSGVCIELSHGRKFIYYEVRVVNQIQEKFDEVLSLFVEKKLAAVIEYCYFKGPIYLYLIPTSKLTNDIGITDKKSPLALHALVQVRHVRRLPCSQDTVPNDQDIVQEAGLNDTALNEAVIKSQFQEIFKKKYAPEEKKETQHEKTKQDKISPLMSQRISLEEGKNTGKPRRKSTEAQLSLPPDKASHEKRVQYQKDAQKWVDSFFSSTRKERSSYSTHNNESLKTSPKEKENSPSKSVSNGDQGMDVEPASSIQPEDTKVSSMDKMAASTLPSENKKFKIDFPSVQKLIREFKQQHKQEKSTFMSKSSAPTDPRLQQRSSSTSSQPDKTSSVPPLVPPPIPPPPPPPVSPFLKALLSLPIVVANMPVAKTATFEPSSVTGVPLVTSPVSPPAVKRQETLIPGLEPTGSPVFQLMKEKVSFMNQSICTSDTYLKDSLISTKSVTTWNQMHPSSPIIASSSTENTPRRTNITNTHVVSGCKPYSTVNDKRQNDPEVPRDSSQKVALSQPVVDNYQSLEKCTAQGDLLDPDIPSYDSVVISRPLTQAEKNSSKAIREIKNILFRNRDLSKNSSAEDDNDDDNHAGHKSEVSGMAGMETEISLKQIEEDEILAKDRFFEAGYGSWKTKGCSKKESIAKEYAVKGKNSATGDRNVNAMDGGNVDERSAGHKQPMGNMLLARNTGVVTPNKGSSKSDSLTSSPKTPELKNGLELLEDLMSCTKRSHQPVPISMPEPHGHQTDPRLSRDSGRRSKRCSRETMPRNERPDEERKKTSPTRKRKVTIKRSKSSAANEKKWDDMTSDISDTELPLDSDECALENRKNSDGYRNRTSPQSKDSARPSSRDGYDSYTKERTPTRRTVSIGRKRDDRDTHRGYRDDHEDWNRKWKRRKLDQDQEAEIPELSLAHDNESTHSDSAMSISSLDSVSFEYAVPYDEECSYNKYRFVRTSPMNGGSLEVTIRRDMEPPDTFSSYANPDDCGNNPYHTQVIPPSSPEEVDMTVNSAIPNSPGTPETAVPCEDFLHTNVGYWATGSATTEGSVTETKGLDDKCFKSTQKETLQNSTYVNEGTWATPSSPYRGNGDDCDFAAARYKHKEPVVKKSRGEGCQRGCSNSGASTGYDYDNTSYMDRNQLTNPEYYIPMEHDRHSFDRGSNTHDSLRDPSDTYEDRNLPQTDCYDDLEDPRLYYISPYEDIDSPRSIGSVEELDSNERYYTTDRIDIYSNTDRHGSPLNSGQRTGQYSEHRGNTDNDYGQISPTPERREVNDDYRWRETLTSDEQRSPTLEGRKVNNNDDYRWRETLTSDEQRSPTQEGRKVNNDDYRWRETLTSDEQRSPTQEGRKVNNDDYRWRGTSTRNEQRSLSPQGREVNDDDCRWRGTLTNDEQRSPTLEGRKVNTDDYRWRGTLRNERRSLSPQGREVNDDYGWRQTVPNEELRSPSPQGREFNTDDYRWRGTLRNEWRSLSPQGREVNGDYGWRQTVPNDELRSPSPKRREVNDDYGWRQTILDDELRSPSFEGRGIIEDDNRWRSTVTSNDPPSHYSPERSESINDKYRERSPLAKNNRTPEYSPKRSRTIGDEYRRSCSPHVSNDRHSQYSCWKGVSHDSYVQSSSLENSRSRSYSPEGIRDDSYRQRSPTCAKRRSYSPEQMGIQDEQRMSNARAERCSYSPDQRGDANDSHGQRSSHENNERSLHYSPDWRGMADDSYRLRSPSTADERHSFFSAYKRSISDDEYARRLPSPDDIKEGNCGYSPDRTTVRDDEYGNYKSSGNDIEPGREYRQDYQKDQVFLPGIDAYQDEEPQGCFSEDEDNEADLQSSYTFDGVDGADTPEYYDKEQHKYLDDIAESTISVTTLALDHAVFDGIKEYPVELLELAKCLNALKRSSDGEGFPNEDGTDSNGNNIVVGRDPRLHKGSSNDDGNADRLVTEAKRRKKSGDHRKVLKPFPRKQSCFYTYNPDKDPECEAVKHYMLKTGAQYLDVSDEDNLKNMSGELRVLVRRKHKQSVHRISNLFKLKLCPTVKFALFNNVEDVSKKTRAYAAIFQYGGVLIPDDAILRTAEPALLEALLGFMAEQNAIHQKFFWVMNIRYIAYKKLGSQRPLTWRDAFVLDLLRKYRNERFVNIINKDYVLENLSPVQRYLDTALKQQLELMPTYKHFILLSDLNKQVVEVSWFLNRGIGFMDLKEWLHLFAGEAKTQQLLSARKYINDGSEFISEGIRHDTLQYDTIDSPEESIEPTSSIPDTTAEYIKPSHEGHHHCGHLSRSLSCNMVSRYTNYKDESNIKEKRLEILSSINSVKTNLMNDMGPKAGNSKLKESVRIQGGSSRQQYEKSRSCEPYIQAHNDRTIPRSTDNHQKCDYTKSLDKNDLSEFKEAQYSKALVKRTDNHGNGRGKLSGTFA